MKDYSDYTRVTEILRPFSGIDSIPKEIILAANERGSRVHALCEGMIEGIDIIIPEEFKGYMDSFFQWFEGKSFQTHPGRQYDHELKITGECDGIYMNREIPWIFDLKTSQKEGKTWCLQGAAYSSLYGIQNSTFVILSKEGKAPKEFHYAFEDHWKTFMQCYEIYHKIIKNHKTLEIEYL